MRRELNARLIERRGEAQRDPDNARRVPRFGHGSRVPGWDEGVDLSKPPAIIPDLATTPVPEELRRAIEAAMAKYPDRRSATIPALHAAQEMYGWCSPEAIEQVGAVMRLTPAFLTSVATFYDMFTTVPKPRHDVFVCTNISCSLRGADELLEARQEAAQDGGEAINVRAFECLGACDIAPMASVDGEYIGPLNLDDAAQVVADVRAGHSVLEHKQLRYRRCADPGVATEDGDFGPPDPSEIPRVDTVGLPPEGEPDRPGTTAPVESPIDDYQSEEA